MIIIYFLMFLVNMTELRRKLDIMRVISTRIANLKLSQ